MPDLIGSNLGPYRILEQIGLGGMATVYKAYQPGMDRLVALKVLPAHYARDPHFVQRFEQEARIVAKLEHRNIVPIFSFGNEAGQAYLVMRYLQAGTVKDILVRGSLPLPDVAKLLSDVASALDYAHSQGIIHRDVKPSNVLVDKQGNAYLTDFGIAKVVESTLEMTGSAVLGTPAYMAPEQTLGKPVTPRTDEYSLGAMLYEMVVGKPPFEADTPLAIALMHVHEPLPLPRKLRPNLPEAIERIILKALAKEPADRYESAGELARAFAQTVGGESITVPSRLIELASAAAANLGTEEVTYDVRAELNRHKSAERWKGIWRWVPATVGLLLLLILSVAAIWLGTQVQTIRAMEQQTGTAIADNRFKATQAALPPTTTPAPTVNVNATQTALANAPFETATLKALVLIQAQATQIAQVTRSARQTNVYTTLIPAWTMTAIAANHAQDTTSWLYNSNQMNHVVFTTDSCTYIQIRPGPVVFHVTVQIWDSQQEANTARLDYWPVINVSGKGTAFGMVTLGPTQNQTTGKWGWEYISQVYDGESNLDAGTYDISATGPSTNAQCTIVVQS